jgi:hypothetical protein
LGEHDRARAKLTAAQEEFSNAQVAEANARVYDNFTLQSKDADALQRMEQAEKAIGAAVEELEAVEARRPPNGIFVPKA